MSAESPTSAAHFDSGFMRESLPLEAEKDFHGFGLDDYAYVRSQLIDGKASYSVHAADGTQLTILDGRDTALATIIQNDLLPLSVH